MSVETVLLIVLAVLLGGVFLLGLAVYLFFVVKAVRDLTKTLERTTEILKPLMEGVGLSDVLKQVEHSCKVAIELGRRTDVLTSTLKMMHDAIFAGKVPNLEAPTNPEASAFFPSSDAANARREAEKMLRDRGIKVSETEAYQPDEDEGVTAPEEQG